ncbi:hypothetical protein C8F01DRAFT_1256941 [Mycena amicta]|nr:hypothetical protein C8F01DRAFT_1256941 [Mycena amicta]
MGGPVRLFDIKACPQTRARPHFPPDPLFPAPGRAKQPLLTHSPTLRNISSSLSDLDKNVVSLRRLRSWSTGLQPTTSINNNTRSTQRNTRTPTPRRSRTTPTATCPLIPQPVVRRLPQPIPAHQLEPPPVDRESDAYGHGRSSASRHRDRTESYRGQWHSLQVALPHRVFFSRASLEIAFSDRVCPQLQPHRSATTSHANATYAYAVAEVHYHEDMTAAEFEATIGGYVEKGYLKATNEQLGASGYDYEQQPVDTPIIGGLAALREREGAQGRQGLPPPLAFCRRFRFLQQQQWRKGVAVVLPLGRQPPSHRPKAANPNPNPRRMLSQRRPSRGSPKSAAGSTSPRRSDLNGSNGKTETQNTFSGGLVIGDDNESDFRYDWNQDFNDPAVRDPGDGPAVAACKPSIYANPRMAASSASFYASGHSQGRTGENAPPVPQLPVGYHQQKRPGFFKRLIGRV